jgi:hypothetical protein
MRLNRRTFHRILLMGAAYPILPIDRPTFAFSSDWHDLAQPFAAQVQRLLAALEMIGEPFGADVSTTLKTILSQPPQSNTVQRLDDILQKRALVDVQINPEGRVSATPGAAKAELVENGWRSFLVRVENQAGATSALRFSSPQALPMGRASGNEIQGVEDFTNGAVDAVEAQSRWMALNTWDQPPMEPTLSGLELEYRILQIYSRDHGKREASIEAIAGAGEQDLGYRSTVAILFDCAAAHAIRLNLRDGASVPAAASLAITDKLGRVYPAQSKRALPDLWFQPQIYRRNGETISLPDGSYSVDYSRGPEYVTKTISLDVNGTSPPELDLPLERWVHPMQFGYYSGDTHIHAAGCSHYESPSEGVTPEVMLRQTEGEALDLGAVLTWAPGFYYQSQFFSGHVCDFSKMQPDAMNMPGMDIKPDMPRAMAAEPLMRYDLEVSGFPSSHCGHLVLLKLKEQDYPGTKVIEDWPSWNLPLLKWAKSQGAVTGYAHSGWGMVVDSLELPNYLMPAFDNCGANEYLVDVTHEGMLDFVSGCDTWPFVELNLWYHVLNCGYRLQFAGETDFPCITDHSVGGGRSYVRLETPPAGDKGYAEWLAQGLQRGRSYFGDGRSHIFGLAVSGDVSGAGGDELRANGPARLHVSARVCARLEPAINAATEKIRTTSPYKEPYWHLERARIANSRNVPVELIVNGIPVQRTEIAADGSISDVAFDVPVGQSSWIALRIFPSSHTNPVFVTIGDRPLRASKRSAEWCRQGVDACWAQKSLRIRSTEIAAAKAAYDHARAAYDRIISESAV